MSGQAREMGEEDIPDNGWDTEVRGRTLAGEDEEIVRAEVIARYLDACDPRPLISAIIKGQRLSATTIRRVAAIFDPDPRVNERVPTVFGIRFSGRLRKVLTPEQADCVRYLLINQKALSEGREPDPRFWGRLTWALRCGHPERFKGPPPQSPIKIRLQFRAQRNRPTDPSLDVRNWALGRLVERARKEGLTKAAAIEQVADECNLSGRTVKRAYYRD